jgi:cytochrome c-type biogenesis protein
MDGEHVTILVAFGAGILSFASPCCLPLVPVYVAHMAGVTVGERAAAHRRVWPALHAMVFVAGFTLIFVAFWASIGLIGYALRDNARYLREAGGAVLIFMGLHLAGVINLGFLNRDYLLHGEMKQGAGFGKSFFLGVFFAAGWTPCIGPVLGAIIGLASFDGESARGTMLLLAYSLGLGVPFVLAAVAVDTVTRPLKRARAIRIAVPIVSGVLVAGIGVLMLTNTLVQMPQYFDWGGGARG